MNERRLLAISLATGLAALGDAPHATAEQALTKVTISYAEKAVDFLPLIIAKDAGYFKKHGIDAKVIYLPAQQGIPALIGNQVQIVGIGGSDAASAAAQGAKLVLVATLDPIYPYQFWVRPQYASAQALKGRRVGIASATGSLYSGTLLSLKALGLASSDVVLTTLGSIVNVNNALVAGSIDAAASHPPATYKFKKAGLVDLLDLAQKKLPSVNGGIWVGAAFLKAHHDTVQSVVDAVVEAIHREETDRAYTESEIADNLGIKDKGELDLTYDFYRTKVLAPGPRPDVRQLQANIDALAAKNSKVESLDVSAMIDQEFVQRAEKREPGEPGAKP